MRTVMRSFARSFVRTVMQSFVRIVTGSFARGLPLCRGELMRPCCFLHVSRDQRVAFIRKPLVVDLIEWGQIASRDEARKIGRIRRYVTRHLSWHLSWHPSWHPSRHLTGQVSGQMSGQISGQTRRLAAGPRASPLGAQRRVSRALPGLERQPFERDPDPVCEAAAALLVDQPSDLGAAQQQSAHAQHTQTDLDRQRIEHGGVRRAQAVEARQRHVRGTQQRPRTGGQRCGVRLCKRLAQRFEGGRSRGGRHIERRPPPRRMRPARGLARITLPRDERRSRARKRKRSGRR